jgi:hypothetical protein
MLKKTCFVISCLVIAGLLRAQDMNVLKGLKWRLIGPFRGGRVAAVAGVDSQPDVDYFGGVGGGVWKTTSGGMEWQSVPDGQPFMTSSVGAIAVSESDSNVVYAGMGEYDIRGNVSHGDGVYKSMDAGKTWKHIGLENTRQIARIRIHPRNPDLVYVAALGHVWGPTRIAASSDLKTAAKLGKRSFGAGRKREQSNWFSIRRMRTFFTPVFGKSPASLGISKAAALVAVCSSQPMAAIRGRI